MALARFNKSIQGFSDTIKAQVFTDGGCPKNPGVIGSWAFIIKSPTFKTVKRSGVVRADRVTNNIMELAAGIEGLRYLTEPTSLELVTDSEYFGKGLTQWLPGWAKHGFRNVNGDLWKELDRLYKFHNVYVTVIKGHAGFKYNEMCDQMATAALAGLI